MNVELVPGYLSAPMSRAPRSEGVHVSSIIRNIAVETGILKGQLVEDLFIVDASQQSWWDSLAPQDRIRISIGLAWEEWYIPQLPNVVDHPGEMFVEGIYMTHDGESLDVIVGDTRHLLILHEIKATYKSIKTVGLLETQWMWVSQCKAYCKGMGATTAYLHVLFLCGDYKYPITPQLIIYKIEFTQEEIETNWDLLVTYMQDKQRAEARA